MSAEELLGSIVRLQVQRESLKASGPYLVGPLLAVEEAAVTPDGMLGRIDGAWIVDVHHAAHPRRRGNDRRALSMGFTAHYDRMAERFGGIGDGAAGENIVVDGPLAPTAEDLEMGLVIQTADGMRLDLGEAAVAAPCLPFTSYLMELPGVAERHKVEDEIEFLDGGTRGFVFSVNHVARPVHLQLGDRVYRRR